MSAVNWALPVICVFYLRFFFKMRLYWCNRDIKSTFCVKYKPTGTRHKDVYLSLKFNLVLYIFYLRFLIFVFTLKLCSNIWMPFKLSKLTLKMQVLRLKMYLDPYVKNSVKYRVNVLWSSCGENLKSDHISRVVLIIHNVCDSFRFIPYQESVGFEKFWISKEKLKITQI